MATKIIYEWTGRYKPPKEGEWYLDFNANPKHAVSDWSRGVSVFILRRVEVESEVDDG